MLEYLEDGREEEIIFCFPFWTRSGERGEEEHKTMRVDVGKGGAGCNRWRE